MQLRKELDVVLNLQGELDAIEASIKSTRMALSKSTSSKDSQRILQALGDTHERLQEEVEALYASLNVPDTFPELRGIDLEFVRILLMARDLKINIRKRAIGSFFEWDKLDQATGGRDQSIGMQITYSLIFHELSPCRHQASSSNTYRYHQTQAGAYARNPKVQHVLRNLVIFLQT